MAKKILLVDDDQYLRELYTEVLQTAGYEVTTANDGEAALNTIQKGGFDLILLYIMMPRLDGIGVLKSLKDKTINPPNGPIVLLTNLAHDPVIQEAASLGAKTYLIKADITPDQLLAKVKEYLA